MNNLLSIFLHIVLLSKIHTNANPLQGSPERIKPAIENEFPFLVSLSEAPATNSTYHFCGGTLISKKHILTSTHCLVNRGTGQPYLNPTDIRVRIGSNNVTRSRKIGIDFWTTYEEWAQNHNTTVSSTMIHDVTIATLTEEVTDIVPVFISQCKQRLLRGRKAVTAGWGMMNDDFQPTLLQKTTLRVLGRKKCRFNLDETYTRASIIVNHLCTISRPMVVLGCGDSGGPLLINGNELIGVNKAVCANDIEHLNEQNIHQSVEYYRKFIEAFAESKAP